jgi:protein-S-isoprenylcysteine O-methyltransferase Ste14
MSDSAIAPLWHPVRRFLMSTPKRTFLLYPVAVIVFGFAVRGQLTVAWWGLPLLVWGFLQYKLTGRFRHGIAKGSSGMQAMPERIVDYGLYRYTRNPMYLGHLIFMTGLVVTFQSWLALAILLVNIVWFHRRVLRDEARLTQAFGAEYTDYKARVKRWIPFIV